jgi:Protein of unknown function (DUF1573)
VKDRPIRYRAIGSSSLVHILLGLVVCNSGCTGSLQRSVGLLVDGDAEHDFGVCRQGDIVHHDFLLINSGDVRIKIVELRSSCGCLVVDDEMGSAVISAGEKLRLPIRYSIGKAQDKVSGTILVGYRIDENPEDLPQVFYLTLRVRASVDPDFYISPREVDFGVIDGLRTPRVSRIVRILPGVAADIRIHDITSSNSSVHAEILPEKGSDGALEIRVDFDTSQLLCSRQFESQLVLSTNSGRTPKSVIAIHAKYEAPAEVSPDVIVIGSDEPGEVIRQVRIRTSCPSRIGSAKCSIVDCIQTKTSGGPPAREHKVELFVKPCTQPLDCQLRLTIELFPGNDQRERRVLSIPIHRLITGGR